MALGDEKGNDYMAFKLGTDCMLARIPFLFPEYKSILFEKWNDSTRRQMDEVDMVKLS